MKRWPNPGHRDDSMALVTAAVVKKSIILLDIVWTVS